MRDIFEDMQALVGCLYISDLPFLEKEVRAQLPNLSLQNYSDFQIKDFAQYVFGTSDITIISGVHRPGTILEPPEK